MSSTQHTQKQVEQYMVDEVAALAATPPPVDGSSPEDAGTAPGSGSAPGVGPRSRPSSSVGQQWVAPA